MTVQHTLICFSSLGLIRVQPVHFQELDSVLDQLMMGSACLVDLNGMPPELSQRAVDILAGACHILDGQAEQIAEGIFFFSLPVGHVPNQSLEFDVEVN